jgi:hypothetical protein
MASHDSKLDTKLDTVHLERQNSDDLEKREERHMVLDAAGQYVDPTIKISPEESECQLDARY